MKFGLIGRKLQHSFSREFFTGKFEAQGLRHSYHNFEIQNIDQLPELLKDHPDMRGLNVTIPYKEAVISYLTRMSDEAREVGAVNTIRIKNGELQGFNTDVWGFRESLKSILKPTHRKALILGTGGASKAVAYVLKVLDIPYLKVSRNPEGGQVNYNQAGKLLMNHKLVINTTPLGTFPDIAEYPPLSFHSVNENHLFYDLIYNPEKTALLKMAEQRGASIKNGFEMLHLQAERAWEIWQEV